MSDERRVDLDSMTAELEREVRLALKQGAIKPGEPYQWKALINLPAGTAVAMLTVVYEISPALRRETQ
jgi:hypothetical protein